MPKNHANKNRTAKANKNMQISAILNIENTLKNAIHIPEGGRTVSRSCCYNHRVIVDNFKDSFF